MESELDDLLAELRDQMRRTGRLLTAAILFGALLVGAGFALALRTLVR